MTVARRAGRCIASSAALAVLLADLDAAAAGARASGPATVAPAAPSPDVAVEDPDAVAPDAEAPVDEPIPEAPIEPTTVEPDASTPGAGGQGGEAGRDGDDGQDADADADADAISVEIDVAYDEVRDSPEGQVATRRIRGGIMLLSAGGLLGIGAIILGATDPCERLAGNSCMESARNRGALSMGLVGLAIVGGGATLLALGLRERKRISAGVQADRRSAGLVISGRF